MHNLHFISVHAENSAEAIDLIDSEVDINNSLVDYFNVFGAFSLSNSQDYSSLDSGSSHFSLIELLGQNPARHKERALDILNCDVVPLANHVNKLKDIILNIDSYKSDLYILASDIQKIAKDIEGNDRVTDLANDIKYDFQWHLTGLTNLHNDPTHIVLVDFHQ